MPSKSAVQKRIDKLRDSLSVTALIMCSNTNCYGQNNMLHYFGSKTILETTIDRFQVSNIDSIVVVCDQVNYVDFSSIANMYRNVSVCTGGMSRKESIIAGFRFIGTTDIVVIHDGLRPYITTEVINASIDSAMRHGSGVVAVPLVDTIKATENGAVIRSLSKKGLYSIQTPQAFAYKSILDAYYTCGFDTTDDSEVYESAGYKTNIIVGEYSNVRLENPVQMIMPAGTNKIGVGFDVHQLVENRKLILGGVTIPHNKGLLGHSDADVLIHAIMDALLSASGHPDIGVIFPNTDSRFKNANSISLLKKVNSLLKKSGYTIGNISAVIMAQQPLLAPHIGKMRTTIATALNIDYQKVNISATTTEHLGIIGNEQGIASSATCILVR